MIDDDPDDYDDLGMSDDSGESCVFGLDLRVGARQSRPIHQLSLLIAKSLLSFLKMTLRTSPPAAPAVDETRTLRSSSQRTGGRRSSKSMRCPDPTRSTSQANRKRESS